MCRSLCEYHWLLYLCGTDLKLIGKGNILQRGERIRGNSSLTSIEKSESEPEQPSEETATGVSRALLGDVQALELQRQFAGKALVTPI